MPYSPLATYVNFTSHCTKPRLYKPERITIHCYIGQVTAKQGCDYFANTTRAASSNYVVGNDGSKGVSVDEANRAWTSSNADNDHRAITIETACDITAPYAVTDAAYNALLDICTDICQRYNKTELIWFGDKTKTLNYKPASNEMVMTIHKWFAATGCPGDYLEARMGKIAEEVTRRLESGTKPTEVDYYVKVTAKDGLNCRNQPGVYGDVITNYPYETILHITKEQNNWGYADEGWVSLAYTEKTNPDVTEEDIVIYYETLNAVPEYYRDAVQKLIDAGVLKGVGDNRLHLSEDLCRMLTILDRLGKL